MPYKDPIKQAEAKKQWYQRNKKLTKKRALESKHRTRAWYREKKTQDCIDGWPFDEKNIIKKQYNYLFHTNNKDALNKFVNNVIES